MKIGEFARQCGTSVRMLRFYEQAGIILPNRTASGYREYDEQEAEFIKKVIALNHAGLALKDIALLRDCLHDKPQNFCAELRNRLKETQAEIDRQIVALQSSKTLLAALLAAEKNVWRLPEKNPSLGFRDPTQKKW